MYVCLCECIRVTHLIPELSAELSSISDKETEAQWDKVTMVNEKAEIKAQAVLLWAWIF